MIVAIEEAGSVHVTDDCRGLSPVMADVPDMGKLNGGFMDADRVVTQFDFG